MGDRLQAGIPSPYKQATRSTQPCIPLGQSDVAKSTYQNDDNEKDDDYSDNNSKN